jgi:hypothetical protein
MSENVITLIWGIVLFFIIFVVNYFVLFKLNYRNIDKNKKRKKKKKTNNIKDYIGFNYLIPKFNLDVNKINVGYMFFCISLINAFIISFVFMIIYIIPWDIPFRLLLGFVLLFGLIYSLYELYGRSLVRKGWKK